MKNSDKKILIYGAEGSGKTTHLLEQYSYLIEEKNISSDNILVLVLNRTQSLFWRKNILLKSSNRAWRSSYYGFVQEELKNWYPIVLEKCKNIGAKRLIPVFLTFESAQFLLMKAIEGRKAQLSFFTGLIAKTEKIAIELSANIVKAANSSIPISEIGERLFNSLENGTEEDKAIFDECDVIINAYMKKCYELGVFDFGMGVELYNKYLLTDERYIDSLKKRIRHLIVDDAEKSVPVEADLIAKITEWTDSSTITMSTNAGYGDVQGGNSKYAKEVLFDKFEVMELRDSFTSTEEMTEFANELSDAILHEKKNGFEKTYDRCIEMAVGIDLRSDMLEEIALKVKDLIEIDGYLMSDIAVISTYADPVTEYVISGVLDRYGIKIKNVSRRPRVVDNRVVSALLTLTLLCHPEYDRKPTKDSLKNLLMVLLDIDVVRSSLLANEIYNNSPFAEFPEIEFPLLTERVGYSNAEKYNKVKSWVEDYRSKSNALPIDVFLQKVFLELILSDAIDADDVLIAKEMIDSSITFVNSVRYFGNLNAGKGFIDMIYSGTKAAESIFSLEERLESDEVLLSTPITYLSGGFSSKVTILAGVSSTNWYYRNKKELTNIRVLTKTWNKDDIYTEEIESENQREFLASALRAIMSSTSDKIIAFESEFAANGNVNNGELAEYFSQFISD